MQVSVDTLSWEFIVSTVDDTNLLTPPKVTLFTLLSVTMVVSINLPSKHFLYRLVLLYCLSVNFQSNRINLVLCIIPPALRLISLKLHLNPSHFHCLFFSQLKVTLLFLFSFVCSYTFILFLFLSPSFIASL